MTMKPKAPKFRIRRSPSRPVSEEPSAPTGGGSSVPPPKGGKPFTLENPVEDGFGDQAFPGSSKADAVAANASTIAEIRQEGLTGRQLRMARRLAQKQGLNPSSDFDAVRLLREQGIDPFDRANMIELVHNKENTPPGDAGKGAAVAAAAAKVEGQKPRAGLPQKVEQPPKNLPGEHIPQSGPLGMHEIERIQRDILRRRRRNLMFLGARLFAFVILPTLACMFYFAFIATEGYATKSEFIVQQAESAGQGGGLLGGTSMVTNQDSILVQGYLKSREAMQRLDNDHGYRAHFSDPDVDSLQRLPEDASNEALYAHYKKHVTVGYDPTEGVLRMEVSALSPEMSQVFSEALVSYAEEEVDKLTERKRGDQMKGAQETYEQSEASMVAAQEKVLALQEQMGILDPQSESAAVMTQISALETQLVEKRLQLSQLMDNARPNQARVAGVEGDIERLEQLIAEERSQLTVEGGEARSLASVTSQLDMARVDLETRTMMMQESLRMLEMARVEANRQVRFLSVMTRPVPPDEPTYPRVFENTLIAFFVFGAIYLLVSVTVAILREQVSS